MSNDEFCNKNQDILHGNLRVRDCFGSQCVTISAKRLTETRGGGTRTVNVIRDLDLHGPSSFYLQGSQSQGGGHVL